MASLPGSVKCLFCNGAVNFMQGGKDKFYKHLGGEHDIHLSHNLVMAINFLDKETLGEIVTQFEASYTSEEGNMPKEVKCILCNGAVDFVAGGKENFGKHLKGEHDIFMNEDLVLAINFLDQETLQEIVQQFEMSYTSIVGDGVAEEEGVKTVISQEDLMMEALKEAEKLKNAAAKNSKDIIDVDDGVEDALITLDDEPMLAENNKESNVKKKYKSFECSVCMAPFDYAWMLSTHMKSHEEKKNNFECSQCGKTFDSSSNLQRHTNFEHKNNNARKSLPEPQNRFNPKKSLPVTVNKESQNRRSSMDVSQMSKLGGLTSISKSTNITKVAKSTNITNVSSLNRATNISKVTVDRTPNTSALSVSREGVSIMGPGPKGSKMPTSIDAARDIAARSKAEKEKQTMAILSRAGVSVKKASPKKGNGLSSAISISKIEPPPPPKPARVISVGSGGMNDIKKMINMKPPKVKTPPIKRNNPLSITPNSRGRPALQGNQRNLPSTQGNTSAQRTPYQRRGSGPQGSVQMVKPVLKTPAQKDAPQDTAKEVVQDSVPSESKLPVQGKIPGQGRVPVLNKTVMPQKQNLKSCEVCNKQFANNELLSKHILSCVSGEIRGVAKSSKSIGKRGNSGVNVQKVLQNGKMGPKGILNNDLVKPVNKVNDSSKSEVKVKLEDPLSLATGKENDEVLDNLNDIISMLEENSDVDKAKVDSTADEADNKNDLDMEVTDNIEMEAE